MDVPKGMKQELTEPSQLAENVSPFAFWLRTSFLISYLVFSAIVLTGYIFNLPILYTFSLIGPATHPFSLIIVLLFVLPIASCCREASNRLVLLSLTPVVLGLLILCLDSVLSIEIIDETVFFESQIISMRQQGLNNQTGANTLLMLTTYLAGFLMYAYKKVVIGQAIISFGLIMPMVSVTGFSIGAPSLHGNMALSTCVLGFSLGMYLFLIKPTEGLSKVLFYQSAAGKITRRLSLVALLFPTVVFLVLSSASTEVIKFEFFRWLFVSGCWFSFLLIITGGLLFSKREVEALNKISSLSFQASHDPLTGLYNRRYFNEILRLAIARAYREEVPFWLMMIDLDHFKKFNDELGHEQGDLILKKASRDMENAIRNTEVLCRWGGEEFIILVEKQSKSSVSKLAKRIQNCLNQIEVPKKIAKVTASIGLTQYIKGESPNRATWRVDQAMYKAKEKRNTIIIGSIGISTNELQFEEVEEL